jgi:hypothetical protein
MNGLGWVVARSCNNLHFLVDVILRLADPLLGVWVKSPCPLFHPSASDLSRVLGPDRMCCAKLWTHLSPGDDMIPDEGIMARPIG